MRHLRLTATSVDGGSSGFELRFALPTRSVAVRLQHREG